MNEYVLMTYYVKYLKEICKVSDSTIKHYQDALRHISKYLVEKKILLQSVYEIKNINELDKIKAYLYSDPEFLDLDRRGHNMYSAGFKHYYKFASGEGFANIYNQIKIFDEEIPIANKHTSTITTWSRSSIIKIQSIESAGYLCEFNPDHKTFIARSTGHPYMEGHHMLPMKLQDKFDTSLDVYANIICLCPVCHRLLHYGIETEKESVVNKIYYDRVDRLAASGIKVSKNEFMQLIL